MDKRGNERLREQKNEYNRFKETPERAPETSIEGRRERQKSSDPHRRDGNPSNFGGPGPALSILLRKIQRKQEPKGLRDWCLGSNTPLGRANYYYCYNNNNNNYYYYYHNNNNNNNNYYYYHH